MGGVSESAYARAGVDQSGAGTAVGALVAILAGIQTGRPSRAALASGHYANVLRLDDKRGLALSCDGVGSKVIVAERLGRLDAVGIDCIAMMMMDVLSHLPEVQICTAYELDGQRTTRFPSHVDDLRRVKPVYETLPGWQTDVTGIRELSDMPANARQYLDRVAELVGKPVEVVSVGPDRAQAMFAGKVGLVG